MSLDKLIFLYKDQLVVCSPTADSYLEESYSLEDYKYTEKGYILILPDNYIYLLSTDIIPTKKGKLDEMIRLYLFNIFPEKEIQERYGYIKTTPAIAFIYTEEVKNLVDNYSRLFEAAHIITTPSLIALLSGEKNFVLHTSETSLIKSGNSFLHVAGRIEDYSLPEGLKEYDLTEREKEPVLSWVRSLNDDKKLRQLNISFQRGEKERVALLSAFKYELLLWGVIYLLFITALSLKIIPLKKDITSYEDAITKIYSSLNLSDKDDPYGVLLYKVNQFKKDASFEINPLRILSVMSTAFKEEVAIENLNVRQQQISMKGRIKNLKLLETATEELSKKLKVKFTIDSASVKGDGVDFVITARLGLGQ